MIAFFTLNICTNLSISVISSSQWNMSLQLVFFELFEEKWLLKRLIFADCTKIRIVFFKDRKDWSAFSKVSSIVSVDFTLETSLRGSCVRICCIIEYFRWECCGSFIQFNIRDRILQYLLNYALLVVLILEKCCASS